MSYTPRQGSQAHMGANYYPGRNDDFQVPVVAPIPQRNNPEMPEHLAKNLADLELAGNAPDEGPDRPASDMSNGHSASQYSSRGVRHDTGLDSARAVPEDEPSFSPFPAIQNRKINVPPTDEEKEGILERSREAVLNSNDPEMQLAWAQDALAYVEISQQNERRLAEFRPPRPQTPKVERRIRTDAINIVDFLGQQHHPKAEFIRGTWLEFGRFGFDLDKREAFRCYSRSAQSGYARAEYRMGMQFESSNEIEKAVRHYNMGVQSRDAASSYRMGMMLLLAQHGQPQDFARGLDLIRFSADNADENAPQGAYVYGMLQIRELAQVHVPEQFLPYDLDTARLNIEKAAYLGFAKAQVKMGAAYELSELNCEFDPVLSLHYNNLAARQGEADAEMAISKWFLSGYEGVFNKNETLAFEYAQRAAASGLATAEFAMGYFYEVGIHVPTSLAEARVWYGKAAEHGNKDATGRIDGISRSKTLSRKDHDKIAMARIKSQRGTQRAEDHQQPTGPSVSMPHIPNYGQSYANPSGPPRPSAYEQRPSSGRPPYDQGYGAPPPGPQAGRPPYGSPAPQAAPNYPQGQYDRPPPGPSGPPGAQYGRPGPGSSPNPPPYGQNTGPGSAYGQQHPYQQDLRPSPNMAQQRIPQAHPPSQTAPGSMAPHTSASPHPNIGFSAPPDLSGADRRRLPQAAPSNRPPLRGGYGSSNSVPSARPQPSQPQASGRPPRGDSMARPPHAQTAPVSKPTPPISSNPSRPPAGGSGNTQAKVPGKGPATFEEMGVPSQKKNDDCVVM